MPFLRFSRDKRGYEHIYLIHAQNRRGKPGRPRVLYWYRTPPGVKVGRVPFDAEMRRTLEAQYPDVTFDWKSLESTPVPPPDTSEPWRERRRLERAAKQARKGEASEGESADRGDSGDGVSGHDLAVAAEALEPATADRPLPPQTEALHRPDNHDDAGDQPPDSIGADAVAPAVISVISNVSPQELTPSDSRNPAGRRRRRRRGGRRHARPGQAAPADGAPNASPAETSEILENASETSIDDADSADE